MDPDKIKGDIHQPYKSYEEQEASDQVDPEKFKKVMKVDESEEAQKRKKRNLPREEEEGEDEPAIEIPSTPSGSFSEFMSDKDELSSVFDKESGGIRRQAAPEEDPFTAPPQESISTEGVDLNENPPSSEMPSPPSSQQTSPSLEPAPSETLSNSSSPSPTPPIPEETEETPLEAFPQFQQGFEQEEPNQPQQGEQTAQESSSTNETNQAQSNQKIQKPIQKEQTDQKPSSTNETHQAQSDQKVQEPTPKEQSDQKPSSKKQKTDTSLLASQPKKSELAAFKKKPKKSPAPKIKTTLENQQPAPKKTPIQQNIIDKSSSSNLQGNPPPSKEKVPEPPKNAPPSAQDTPQEKSPEDLKKREDTSPGDSEKQGAPFERFTPEQIRDQKIGKEGATSATYEGLVVPTSTESEQGDMGEQGKKKEDQTFIEATSQTAGIPLPTFETPAPLMTSSTELPAYSTLSSEMHELFEKIGGVILVQQEKGVTTTTVNINMPNSVFDGAQVMLSQYSTAPNAYNIQLIGNPESVKIFSQNIEALKNSFEQANYNFEVHIQNPILSKTKKSPHLIRRKKSAGGKKDK